MKIGIGLPNPVPSTPGTRLVEWAKLAEERGFSGLATIDRAGVSELRLARYLGRSGRRDDADRAADQCAACPALPGTAAGENGREY